MVYKFAYIMIVIVLTVIIFLVNISPSWTLGLKHVTVIFKT